jgi:outer membrane immunogenic protein
MKRIALIVAAGLLAIATASPAVSSDLPRPSYKAPIYSAPGFSWSGFYVGINGGYGWGTSAWSSAVTTGTPKPTGGLVGGTLGYNYQIGTWVLGLEGDFDAAWLKGTDGSGSGVCTGVGCQSNATWLATARGRIGYAWDRWLPFITGGAAFDSLKMTPAGGTSTTQTKIGWTIGGGVEYAFYQAWSAKLEYLYADLGNANCAAATCGIDTNVKFKPNIVRVGVNYRF